MKILLLGKDGQVGWELQRALAPLGELRALGRADADLAHPETLRAPIAAFGPDVIVNAAAYTAVDKAESDAATARSVNALAPGVLAEEAAAQRRLAGALLDRLCVRRNERGRLGRRRSDQSAVGLRPHQVRRRGALSGPPARAT